MNQLSSQDAQYLYLETNKSLSHLTLVSIFDPSTAPSGSVRFKQIIEHVRSRVHTSPIYQRRLYTVPLELDFPYWVDDEHFDVEYHIHHSRLPHPNDWRQLCIYLARYHSRPMNMNRPLWEMNVIEGLDNIDNIPKGSYAIATKIHHCAADGAAILNFGLGLFDINAEGHPITDLSNIQLAENKQPSLLQVTSRGWLNNIKSPVNIVKTLAKASPEVLKLAVNSLTKKNDEVMQAPHTRFNQPISPHRVFDGTNFDLSDFKAIRQLSPDCTINDVVLAVCSGALRKYLQHHKELPKESLVSIIPVNSRTDKNSGDILNKKDAEAGNSVELFSTALFTHLASPVDRLKSIHASTRNLKAEKTGLPVRMITDVSRHAPASAQFLASRLFLSNMSNRMTNVFISNVPGPPIPFYMNGAKMINQFGLAPISDQMGLFIATPSYNGSMSFGVTSSRDTMPDVSFFIECLRSSFDELMAEVLALNEQPSDHELVSDHQVVSDHKETSRPKEAKAKPAARKKVTRKTTTKKTPAKKAPAKKTPSS